MYAEWRKPKPGMLIELMDSLGFTPVDTLYIGDRDSDQQAAEAAGINFIWAKDFFGWESSHG